MLLALVGSKVILFSNAVGIILGANLGTTITGWIVSAFGFKFDISALVNPILFFGTFGIIFFSKNQTIRRWSKFLIGFGLVFFGINIMKDATQILIEHFDPAILQGRPLVVYALVGFIFTAIIQSSSATMVIVLTAMHANVITLYPAAALIIGADLGTTITVIFGALAGESGKKRVAAAHFSFNLIANFIAFLLLYPLMSFAQWVTGPGEEMYSLVLFHSSFNVIGVLMFYPFLRRFSQFIEKLIPVHPLANKTGLNYNSIYPEVALLSLKSEASGILGKIFILNKYLLSPNDKNSQLELESLFSHQVYDDCYHELKASEAEIIQYAHALQEQTLSQEQSIELKYILSSIRHAAMAAKSFKDIKHNLIEFENSTETSITEVYQELVDHCRRILSLIPRELNAPALAKEKQLIFSKLVQDITTIKTYFSNFNQKVETLIRARKLPSEFISSLLNANHEIYQANRFLVVALGDILLSPQQADDLQSI